MNSNKFYCRNGIQPIMAESPSALSSSLGCGNTSLQNFVGCNSVNSSSEYGCKDLLSRTGNSKNILNHHLNGSNSYGSGTGSSDNYNSSNSNGTGNYIMPAQVGTSSQYHRRKIPNQEYQQSRIYYNTDYKSRDDFYTIGSMGSVNIGCMGNGKLNTASSSPTLQNQQLIQQNCPSNNALISQTNHMVLSQQQQNLHQTQQSVQGQNQYQHHLQQLHNQSPTICSPDNNNDECTQLPGIGTNCRILQASHQHIGEQVVPSTTPPIGTITVSGPPLMYTVHRVVTTAQIQTATGNTYASSSSISSVVSAVRNEDCTTVPISSKTSPGCSMNNSGLSGMASVNILTDSANNYINQNLMNVNTTVAGCGSNSVTGLRSSSGLSTNYLTHQQNQQKSNQTNEDQHQTTIRISNNSYNSSAAINGSYLTGTKSSSISRPLQNVIPTCVYLMSRVAVHMEIDGTSHCPAQVMLAAALGCEELGIANKLLAQSIFGLWMTSALLEIQLKSHHRPYVVRVAWKNLLEKFSRCNPIEIKFDEPMVMLKRNVFFSKKDEEKIKDHRILELLYEEAKHNVLTGRYVMEPVHSLMLGGIQARIELGPFNTNAHTISFFRENQSRFLPAHVAKSSSWSWLPVSRKNSAEVKLLEQFKRVPQTATTRKLMRKYLEFCWALPFYGSAYFQGQVEQPLRGVMSFVNHKDIDVLIAVNERGLFIIDPEECTLLLGLRYEDFLWDFAKPSSMEDSECLTCIFLQFDAFENGIQISKLMQIFSKQAPMIDALISHFAEQMRKRKLDINLSEQYHDEPNPIQNAGTGVLCNKLSRLTLATFDEDGHCIGQMGSLSISY